MSTFEGTNLVTSGNISSFLFPDSAHSPEAYNNVCAAYQRCNFKNDRYHLRSDLHIDPNVSYRIVFFMF